MNKETVQERIVGYAWEDEAAQTKVPVGQLNHENDGEPDFAVLAKKLEERKQKEAKGENEGFVKMTIYVDENLAKSFYALITKRGQQKQFINQAIRDFIQKKAKELGI